MAQISIVLRLSGDYEVQISRGLLRFLFNINSLLDSRNSNGVLWECDYYP